ncbi:MAG: glutaredoxin [Eggerthellaceae bacterium]|nr:glutaredoxin [Eggerthellaceae bacterium]
MAYIPNIVLYFKPTCPYCTKVLAYMQEQDIACDMKDTLDPANADELIRIGGKRQVPCLVIDGQAMYESNDIIQYLHGLVAAEEIG